MQYTISRLATRTIHISNDDSSITRSLRETINPRDVFQDAIHNFSNKYKHYIQHSNRVTSTLLHDNDDDDVTLHCRFSPPLVRDDRNRDGAMTSSTSKRTLVTRATDDGSASSYVAVNFKRTNEKSLLLNSDDDL